MNLKTSAHSETISDQPTTRRPGPALGWLVLLIPILLYGWYFTRYAINIPKFDDHALRAFLLNLEKADSFHDKAYEFLRQHNEHRIVLDRVFSWLDYKLTGKLNYVHLMVLGNLSLVLLVWIFVKALQKAKVAVWMALPVSLLIFNLSQWENMLWGMAALQNFTVMTLAVATFYQLAFQNRVGWLAILFPVLATLTSGNGLLIWPVGLIILVLRQDYSGVIRWLLATAITFRLYFLGYEKPAGNPPDQGTLLDQVHGWLLFNGAAGEAFPVQNFLLPCLVLGVLVVGIVVWIGVSALWKRFGGTRLADWQLFFLGGVAFIVGTGLIVAFNRVGFGLETLITSRYKIYSLTLLSFLITYWIARINPSKRFMATALATVFSALLAFFSYSTYLPRVYDLRHYLTTHQFNYTYTQLRPVSTIDADTRRMVNPAPAFYDIHLPALYQETKALPSLRLDTLYKEKGNFVVRQDSFPTLGVRDEGAYLVARSAQRVYLLPTQQSLSGSRKGWFQPQRIFNSRFIAQLPETELDRGTYDVLLLAVGPNDDWQLYQTGQQLVSSGPQAVEIPKNW
ncbi:hypothetical protein GCM10027347_61040 [Larkinella harenae]